MAHAHLRHVHYDMTKKMKNEGMVTSLNIKSQEVTNHFSLGCAPSKNHHQIFPTNKESKD